MGLIADLKSGFFNIAKILGINDVIDSDSDQTVLLDKISEKFIKLE